MKSENPLKAVVSVSEQCRLLRMSRSQYYAHAKKGTFHKPLRLPSNGRPYFTASMIEDNLRARETGVGVNGEYVIFYQRQTDATKPAPKKTKADYAPLLDGVRRLGLADVTTEQIAASLEACFPKGTADEDETSVLRAVFRHLKRSGVG